MISNMSTPLTEPDIIHEIKDIELQILNLKAMKKKGIVNSVDTVISELTKREFKLKEKKVLKVHKYAITEVNVKKGSTYVTRWQTRCGDLRPRCCSYNALIEKLFTIYFGDSMDIDYTFKGVFDAALDERIRTEQPKEKTIRDYYSSYRAFITDEFGSKDIRLITPSMVKEYLQTTSQRLNPTKKRFYKFKGLLNMVFEYACDPERRLIEINPVPQKNKAYEKNFSPSSSNPEDKAFQPHEIELIRNHLWERVHSMDYDVNGYAILFSSETGVREGEIPSLKWEDVTEKAIHIHSQQNDENRDGKKVYYYNPTTKNEKGVSHNGRYIPVTTEVRKILSELKGRQEMLGIQSEWVFCNEDGNWITTVSYYESLYRLCKKLNLKLSNNHAFRMALNSYVYVPMGLPVTERAKLLGHSVETNLRHYTFARTDDYMDELTQMMDAFKTKQTLEKAEKELGKAEKERGTSGYPKIIHFPSNKKSLISPKNQAFS